MLIIFMIIIGKSSWVTQDDDTSPNGNKKNKGAKELTAATERTPRQPHISCVVL